MESNSSRRQITAKFASVCPDCRLPIREGSQVMWAAGSKATHVICPVSFSDWNADAEQALSEGYAYCTLESSDKDDRSYEAWLAFLASQVTQITPKAQITVEDAGVYVVADQIVKMKANKAKTATYPMLWTEINGERLNGEDAHVRGEWLYIEDWQARRALLDRVVNTGRRMNLGEAKAFIIKYGQCVRCSRKLVAAKSVEQGIGPVCIKYFEGAVSGAEALLGQPIDAAKLEQMEANERAWYGETVAA